MAGRQLPRGAAGYARRSRASTRPARVEVPVAEVRGTWIRPHWDVADRYPPMEEDAERVGLAPVIRTRVAARPALECLHIAVPQGSCPGYPDLHIWGPGGMAWWELKGSAGRVYRHQVDTILRIRAAGGTAAFVWPEDLHSGWVDAELDRLAGTPPRARARVLKPGHRFCGCPLGADHQPTCDFRQGVNPWVGLNP